MGAEELSHHRARTARLACPRRVASGHGGAVRVPRVLRLPPVLHVRPPSVPPVRPRTERFRLKLFSRHRAPACSPSHARHPPLTSPLGLPATRRVQPNPDTQRKQTELWKSLILGCVESARRRMAFFTRTTRPFGPRVFTNHCAASLTFPFRPASRLRPSRAQVVPSPPLFLPPPGRRRAPSVAQRVNRPAASPGRAAPLRGRARFGRRSGVAGRRPRPEI